MYEFQDLTPISGHFRTNFKISGISGQCPGLHYFRTVETFHVILKHKYANSHLYSELHYIHKHTYIDTNNSQTNVKCYFQLESLAVIGTNKTVNHCIKISRTETRTDHAKKLSNLLDFSASVFATWNTRNKYHYNNGN